LYGIRLGPRCLSCFKPLKQLHSVPHLYIIQLDTGLKILNAVRYDQVSSEFFYVSDMVDDGSFLHVTGTYEDKDGIGQLLYGVISKDDLGSASWYYFPLSFPGYDVRLMRGKCFHLSRIVLTSVRGTDLRKHRLHHKLFRALL
jgi:hypothetical protein